MSRALLPTLCALLACALLPAAASAAPLVSEPSSPPATFAGQDGRVGLGGNWLFRLDPTNAGRTERWFEMTSTEGWSTVRMPNSWNANDNADASHVGSVGWYRRDFILPETAGTPTWLIRFLSVNHRMRAWLNGREIGTHSGPYLPFEFELKNLRRDGVNSLVIRIGNRRKPVDFPPGRGLNGGWWNYGGILREVEMRPVRAVDIADVRALTELECRICPARVRVRVALRNYRGRDQIADVDGRLGDIPFDFGRHKVPAEGERVLVKTVVVDDPELWSPTSPTLYPLRVRADVDGIRARFRTRVGIRSVEVVDGRLELNGRPIRLHGVGIHEDAPGRGHALSAPERASLMERIRRLGASMFRAHYPLHPDILEQADESGLLVWSEVPVYRMKLKTLAKPGVVDRAIALAEKNVEANATHPSIFTWSLGNELATAPAAAETDLFARGSAAVRRIDPTRPVSLAVQVRRPYECFSKAYAPIDLLGINEYFGWYSGTNEELGPYLDANRACHPDQALMVTEFGAEANRSGPVEEKGTYQFQSAWTERHLRIFDSKSWLSGDSYWALNEFKVRPGWAGGNPRPDPPMHRKGLISFEGVAKPVYPFVRDWFAKRKPKE